MKFSALFLVALFAACIFPIVPLPLLNITVNPALSYLSPELFTSISYGVTPLALREMPRYMNYYALKVSSSAKDDFVAVGNPANTPVYVYSLSGGGLSLVASSPGIYSSANTSLTHVTATSAGSLLFTGVKKSSSTLKYYPFAASLNYNSGTLPNAAQYPLSGLLINNDKHHDVETLESGDLNGDGTNDIAISYNYYTTSGFSPIKTRIYAKTSQVGTTYTMDDAFTFQLLKIGNFDSLPGNEIAFTGIKTGGQSEIHLFKYEGGALSKVSGKDFSTSTGKKIVPIGIAAADVDSDGYDELLVAGSYLVADAEGDQYYHDVLQLYKHTASGWVRKGEILNATGTPDSTAISVAAGDINYDGKLEVMPVYAMFPGDTTKTYLYVYRYTTSPSKLNFLSNSYLGEAEDGMGDAVFGDYNGDGKLELAYGYDTASDQEFVQIYFLGTRDTSAPQITFLTPQGSSFGTEPLNFTFFVSDKSNMNHSSLRTNIVAPSGAVSHYYAQIVSVNSSGTRYKLATTVSFNTSGNYQFNVTIKDMLGNQGAAIKPFAITVPAVPGPAAPANATPASPEPEPAAPEPAPAAPSEPSPPQAASGSQQATSLITELEIRIQIANELGKDTSAMETYLATAKAYRAQDSYVDAALEAQKGLSIAQQYSATPVPQPAPDVPGPLPPSPIESRAPCMPIAIGIGMIALAAIARRS